ncbi:hypothetical protein D9758_007244 [Tetrapyrgos nigripes]|uniref:Mannitol-1-phosphate 5-dehydrogenase n=1 Tax=Tetrapyrgos nigripes TaxID=182062 RepID=A0A8H5FWN7_9AGAR|nr:hypothetical protein D9758_007244 [Tetrapyrgos nigripes]
MVFRTQQGTQSQTFKPPPLDFSLNLLEVHDFNAEHSPNHPLFRYMTDDETAQTIYWGEAVQAFHVAQGFVQTLVKNDHIDSQPAPVIAILATLDSITYHTLLMGIMHAGFVPFPISTRNSEAAVAHLLKVTNAVYVFANPDNAMQSLAQKACHQLGEGNGIQILPTPVFDDFYKPTQKDFKSSARSRKFELDETAFILHSSGSTSFPKPIKISHRNFLGHGIEPYYGETDYCGQVISAAAFPMFHAMGVILVPETAMVGVILGVFQPKNIPVIPTPENVFKNALVTKCTIMMAVPSMLETWAKDSAKVEVLAKYRVVLFGGGPLVPAVGNELVKKGVTLRTGYGLTEIGGVSTMIQRASKEGWEYFSISPKIDPVFLPVEGMDNIVQLIVKKCKTHTPNVLDTVIDGQPAFDTKDLLVRHPTNPSLFKIYGRADDQIMHSTGEKTNPLPIESLLLRDERITHAIMFGRAKFQAGVLITPSDALVFDPVDTVKLAEYRNLIWDVVQRANDISPQHSKIFKELIVVTTPSKPLELTAKATPRRGSSLKAYEEEIEKAYQALEESSQPDIQGPAVWDTVSVTVFITKVVENALGFKVHEHDDLFRVGADSLNATYIRNTITRALRDAKSEQMPLASIRALPENFVYDNASIAALSKFVLDIPHTYAAGAGAEKDKEEDDDDDDDDPEGDYQWPKMGQPGETILQVRKGKGEPPLMIIHGAGGRVDGMIHFQQKFRSALWLFQVTPDLPRKSLREHAEFYYRKVKELRPHGPYRLAAYSGSHLIGFVMLEMMLRDGEEVIQFDLIDQSPSFMFSGVSEDVQGFDSDSVQMNGNENETARPDRPPLEPSFPNPNFDITSPSFRSTYKSHIIHAFYNMGAREGRIQFLQVFKDAWEGRPAPDVSVVLAETVKWSADESWDFVAGLPGYQESNASQFKNTWERCLFAIEHWLKNISGISRVPITVYVASYGVIGGVKDEKEKEKWKESGLVLTKKEGTASKDFDCASPSSRTQTDYAGEEWPYPGKYLMETPFSIGSTITREGGSNRWRYTPHIHLPITLMAVSSNKPVAIHFGAGNIGRGFIGAVLSQAGFRVVFVDVQKNIIDALNREHGYDLHLMNSQSHAERIEDVCGVMSTDLDEIEKFAKDPVSIITTAVGASVLPKIAKPIAQIIKTRMEDNRGPINIVACENLQHATVILQEAVEKELNEKERKYMRDNIGFAVCAVDRIVPPFEGGHNILEVGVEPFYEWTVDENSLKKTDPDVHIKGMHTTDNLDAYVQRKLFTLNCGHAITAYLGFLAHKSTILDAIKTSSIHSIVSEALHESGAALVKKHSVFNGSDHNKYIETTLHRFANPHMHDEVTRVGREPLRKLKQGDRLLGPIEMCRELNLPRDALLKGVAAALLFSPQGGEDEEATELQERLFKKGVKDVVLELTGWKDDDEDLGGILKEYENLKGKNFN